MRKHKGKHGCGRCPARWDGANMAHCSVCCHTFTGVTAFDGHRSGPDSQRSCSTGKYVERRPGVWGSPADNTRFVE